MAAVNTHFKPSYTQEEIEECFQWFEQHMDQLPATLHSIKSMRFNDLPATVARIIKVLRPRMKLGRTFNGEFALLLQIREKVEEEWNTPQ